ncbi:MAG TPA: hypothetical protein VGT61_00005 [Thermomicrobiales bacterium]|jgi:hypothetical protein|nr:hypothetical protein [Thermomicrobiales bacterium]
MTVSEATKDDEVGSPGQPVVLERSLEDWHADLHHAVWITDQLLGGIDSALKDLRGQHRHRLERQRRLLRRERDSALLELTQFEDTFGGDPIETSA